MHVDRCPRGLKREEMSWQARMMMGIADIFEALTAGDRPYKDAMTLSQALDILDKFRHNDHIDPDLGPARRVPAPGGLPQVC